MESEQTQQSPNISKLSLLDNMRKKEFVNLPIKICLILVCL
jgi:hypothetical protein